MVTGELLNAFFKVQDFEMLEEYQVCSNMAEKMWPFKLPRQKRHSEVVLDSEKCHSDRLKAPNSLKETGFKNLVMSYTNHDRTKKPIDIHLLNLEGGQELDTRAHFLLMC